MEGKTVDRDELLNLMTTEDVIDLLLSFGSDYPTTDQQGNLIFNTICHNGAGNGSHKLWYYVETKSFYCFSSCGAMSLIDLTMKMLNLTFKETLSFLCDYKGVSAFGLNEHRGFEIKREENEDLEFLNLHLSSVKPVATELTVYDETILQLFHPYYPESWCQEGISPMTAERYNIRFCFTRNAAIIPYYNDQGQLIGIRQRNFDPYQLEMGRKYIPTTIEQTSYRYPTSQVFFGLYQNQAFIKKAKEVVLVESEKSVMLYDSYYPNRSIALAMGGSSLSLAHRKMLLDLKVERVVICLDKDYHPDQLRDKTSEDYKAFVGMIRRLKKMVTLLSPYMTVSVILCFDSQLDYKDSPLDRGKEVFEALLKSSEIIDESEALDPLLTSFERG